MATLHLWITFAIIGVTIIAYASERYAVEQVAIASLTAFLLLFGVFPYTGIDGEVVDAARLLMGFANPALVTVMALLIVGQGLFATDAVEGPAKLVGRLGGSNNRAAIVIVTVSAAILSAFLNNTPVVLIFIPVLTVVAAQRNYPAAKVFIPLSFLSILGGMTTLIGSSTNLIAAGAAARYGVTIDFFDLTGMGLILASVGAVYVLFVVPLILDERPLAEGEKPRRRGAHFIGEITITENHPFLGIESRAGILPGLGDLTVRLLQRRGVPILPPFEDVTLSRGDRLLVSGTSRAFSQALSRGRKSPGGEENKAGAQPGEDSERLGPDYHLAEAVVAPGSQYVGRSIDGAATLSRYGTSVVGIRRKARMARTTLENIRLEAGDTLLVGGPYSQISRLKGDHELLLLEHSAEHVPQSRKAWIAILIFASVVFSAALGILPITVASVVGAFAMLATGCLTLYQATRAFDRQIYLLVGSAIAMATALEATGGAELIADTTLAIMDGASPSVIVSALFLVMALMTNILSNNATALIFMPIALGIAAKTGASPRALAESVIFAANCSFATPIAYQTNLLVMSAGRYRFSDFLKTGTPLVLLIWLTFSIVSPWYYGMN